MTMRKLALILFVALPCVSGQTQLAVTSAAAPKLGVTADSLASVFGDSISTTTMTAPSVPWPTSLGDITVVWVTDAGNAKQMAGIGFISPSQMNIYIPPGVAVGPATISFPVTGLPPGAGTPALRSVGVNIQKVAPALFSANGTGSGVAAATAVQVTIPTGIQSAVPVFTCNSAGSCSAVPIALGVDAPIYVSLYGAGIRGASSLSNVSLNIGGVTVQPLYAGAQGQTPGLDQVNFALPLSLHGAGVVTLSLTVDGVTSNPVQLAVQ